jgi:hypothetical protein
MHRQGMLINVGLDVPKVKLIWLLAVTVAETAPETW